MGDPAGSLSRDRVGRTLTLFSLAYDKRFVCIRSDERQPEGESIAP